MNDFLHGLTAPIYLVMNVWRELLGFFCLLLIIALACAAVEIFFMRRQR